MKKNTNGKINLDTSIEKINQPVKILDDIRDVYLGQYVVYAITFDNELYGWENKTLLGIGSDDYSGLTEPIKLMDNVREIIDENFVLKEDSSLWAWGYSSYMDGPRDNSTSYIVVKNQLGLGSEDKYITAEKVIDNVKSIT